MVSRVLLHRDFSDKVVGYACAQACQDHYDSLLPLGSGESSRRARRTRRRAQVVLLLRRLHYPDLLGEPEKSHPARLIVIVAGGHCPSLLASACMALRQ